MAGTKALIIIDVQKGMFGKPPYSPHDGSGMVERLAGLAGRMREAGVPLFYVQHDGGAESPLAKDGPGFAFREELAPQPGDDVTVKQHCSAFQDTDFAEKLRAAGIEHLIIGGMLSEFCVDTAVRGSFERGFGVTLIADGHTTFDTPALSAKQNIAHHNYTLGGGGFAALATAEEL